ncbi:hypothetical protein RIF29_03309 [Crotalaria pallida]|uniref:Uncharacterized protein n=1 Tax=Crotalaria pallida TaxID=3830 RepID=A0AAN9J153_CROPI
MPTFPKIEEETIVDKESIESRSNMFKSTTAISDTHSEAPPANVRNNHDDDAIELANYALNLGVEVDIFVEHEPDIPIFSEIVEDTTGRESAPIVIDSDSESAMYKR